MVGGVDAEGAASPAVPDDSPGESPIRMLATQSRSLRVKAVSGTEDPAGSARAAAATVAATGAAVELAKGRGNLRNRVKFRRRRGQQTKARRSRTYLWLKLNPHVGTRVAGDRRPAAGAGGWEEEEATTGGEDPGRCGAVEDAGGPGTGGGVGTMSTEAGGDGGGDTKEITGTSVSGGGGAEAATVIGGTGGDVAGTVAGRVKLEVGPAGEGTGSGSPDGASGCGTTRAAIGGGRTIAATMAVIDTAGSGEGVERGSGPARGSTKNRGEPPGETRSGSSSVRTTEPPLLSGDGEGDGDEAM